MKKRLIISTLLILALIFTLASCRNKKIESIEIISGTAPTEVYVGEQPDFSGMKLLIKYNDGSSMEISASDANIGAVDTSKPTTRATYTIEYQGFTTSASITVKAKSTDGPAAQVTLTGITYLSGLNTNIFVGGELDTAALKVTATYSDGSTMTIDSKQLTTNIASFDKFAVGTQTLVITYEGLTCSVNITVQEVRVVAFTLDNTTYDTAKGYFVGDTVDTSRIVGKAEYNNGEIKDIANSDLTFSAIDNTTAGTKILKVTYAGITKEIAFIFNEIAPTSLTYVSGTIPSVVYGDAVDTSAIKALLKYNNGDTEELDASKLTFSEADTATAGEKTLTASFGTFSFTVQYTVLDITAIEVKNISKEVVLDGTLDYSAVQLKLTLSNGQTKTVTTGITVDASTFSSASLGETYVTVSYKDKSVQYTVEVVEILSGAVLVDLDVVGGVTESIYEGQSFTLDNIALIATFSNNQTLQLTREDITVNGTVGTAPASYTLTISYTYEGVTKECTITVNVIELKVTRLVVNLDEVSVERNPFGTQPDLSRLTAIAYYNNGTQKALALSDLSVATVDVTTVGEQVLTVTFEEGTDTLIVKVIEPTITDVKIFGEYANKHIIGEAYNVAGVKAEVYYSNGEVVVIDATAANAAFNENTGVLSVSYGGKSATQNITLLNITSVAIDTQSFNTAPDIDQFSTDGLKLIVYLSDGSNVKRDAANGVTIDASSVNAGVMGTYQMTASYLGVTSNPVNIEVIDANNYVITGTAYPTGISRWVAGTLQENFLDKGYKYAVGDDNPFKFQLLLTYRNVNTDAILSKQVAYTGDSHVYDMDGNEVGADIVAIDDVNHTFDFTEAAIGNCYKITSCPANVPELVADLFTKELVVEVVDGFNVHEAIDLNVITNVRDWEIGGSGYDQLTVLYSFMQKNADFARNMSFDEYASFVNGIKGVVLHNFMSLEVTDFPEEYFFITKDGSYYLWDHFALYFHTFNEAGTFNFYGNYFEIETNAIPCVATPGSVNNKNVETNNVASDPTSNSEIFRFRTALSILDAASANNAFDHSAYKANFYALSMSDNDKSTAEQTEIERQRSTLGAYAFKLAKAEYTFNSVNIQRYYISVMNEYDCLTVNYNYCTFYDSWNNHISIWSANTIDETDDSANIAIHDGHAPIKIFINNSIMAKCGGPVIIASSAEPTKEYNKYSGSEVVVDDKSVLYSYVAGTESWFISYSATSIADSIKGLSYMFGPSGAQFTTTMDKSGTTQFMNMIYLNLSSKGLAGLTDDIDGKFTIGGKTLVDMNDTSIYQNPVTGEVLQGNFGQAYVDTVRLGAQIMGAPALPPIFMSSDGGFTTFDGTTLTQTVGPAFTGNMLTMYYQNMGMLMGYNQPHITGETAPRDITTITRVTTAHGYN